MEMKNYSSISPTEHISDSNQKPKKSLISKITENSKTPEKANNPSIPTKFEDSKRLSKSAYIPEIIPNQTSPINGNISPIMGNLSKLHARVDNIIQKSPVQVRNSAQKENLVRDTNRAFLSLNSAKSEGVPTSSQSTNQQSPHNYGIIENSLNQENYKNADDPLNYLSSYKKEEILKKNSSPYQSSETVQIEKALHPWGNVAVQTNRSVISIHSSSISQSNPSPKKFGLYDKGKLDRILDTINSRGGTSSLTERTSTLY